jgi:hypothetical protein
MLRVVPTKKTKLLTVRFTPEQLDNFQLAAELEGGTMSSLTRGFVFRKIRDAKEREPEAFKREGDLDRPVLKVKYKRPTKGKTRNSKG